MADRIKTVIFLICALSIPLIGLGIGWYNWDLQTGVWIMAGTFFFFFILGGLLLISVRDLSWLTVSLPYLFGLLYGIIPDPLPLPVDDMIVSASGALLTYALALRKKPGAPKWIILPLMVAAIYMFFGGPIPGVVDELIVNLVAVAMAGFGLSRSSAEE